MKSIQNIENNEYFTSLSTNKEKAKFLADVAYKLIQYNYKKKAETYMRLAEIYVKLSEERSQS